MKTAIFLSLVFYFVSMPVVAQQNKDVEKKVLIRQKPLKNRSKGLPSRRPVSDREKKSAISYWQTDKYQQDSIQYYNYMKARLISYGRTDSIAESLVRSNFRYFRRTFERIDQLNLRNKK